MYSLRGYGGNHLGMFAGTRSDFIITQHPEFNLGRLASERGLGHQWNTTKCATSKSNRSWVMQKLNTSMRESSPRLCGPRWDGTTLKQRALARSLSMPEPMPEERQDCDAGGKDLRKAMKAHALRKKYGRLPEGPLPQQSAKHPVGLGRYNYTVPAQALPFIQDFKPPMSEPLPMLPKAYWSPRGFACAR
eukprot:s1955_g14.t1